MSKDKETASAIEDLLGSAPQVVEQAPAIELKLKTRADEEYKIVSMRMSVRDKEILTDHFKRKGIINFSTGVRQIIADYMESNGL